MDLRSRRQQDRVVATDRRLADHATGSYEINRVTSVDSTSHRHAGTPPPDTLVRRTRDAGTSQPTRWYVAPDTLVRHTRHAGTSEPNSLVRHTRHAGTSHPTRWYVIPDTLVHQNPTRGYVTPKVVPHNPTRWYVIPDTLVRHTDTLVRHTRHAGTSEPNPLVRHT